MAGEAGAVAECIAALEKIVIATPDNHLARVYLGSAYTLQSRDLGLGPGKLAALRKGLRTMEQAVEAAPRDARVRFVQAITLQAMPAFLGQRKKAQGEVLRLAGLVEKTPGLLPAEDRQTVFLNAGYAAQSAGDRKTAVRYWKSGLSLAADPRTTADLRNALAKHGK